MFTTDRNTQSGPRIELLAGLRVTETSFDDAHGAFVIEGSLEFGSIPEGSEVCLPVPGREQLYVPISTVTVVENPDGTMRLAISVPVPFEDRKSLESLNVVGQQLQVVRRIFEKFGEMVSGCVQFIFAILGFLILVGAFFFPTLGVGPMSGKSVAWTVAAAVILIGAVALIRNNLRWSLLVLIVACVFFFTTCTANFNLHLD